MVKIVGENKDKFEKSCKFQEWLNRFDDKSVKSLTIKEFWSLWNGLNELIFVLVGVECLDEEGGKRGGVVFFRSDAAAVFLVIKDKDTDKKYVVLIEQLRIPSGGKLLEIPAGGKDENDDSFIDTIIREVSEEVGIWPNADSYNFLGLFYLSPGACNERMALFSCEFTLGSEEIKKLEGKLTGTPGEHTKVKLYPLEDFDRLPIKDAKTMLAYLLYARTR